MYINAIIYQNIFYDVFSFRSLELVNIYANNFKRK